MPSENPNLNSQRMQRAQRINNIEESRLLTQMHLLDKERKHRMRVSAQDMRMVQLTLEYIHASSGYSPEALPPDYVETTVEKVPEPCFMYGQRLKKWKKSRRAQSAPSISQHRRKDTEEEEDPNSNNLANGQRKGWGSAYFPMESIREDTPVSDGQTRSAPKARRESIKLQARLRPKTCTATRTVPDDAASDTRKQEDLERALELSRQELASIKLENHKKAHSRKADITQAVNKVRVMAASARRMRNVTPMQALVMAPTKTVKQRMAWESKLSENTNRNQRLDAKLRIFMSSYPNRSVTIQSQA